MLINYISETLKDVGFCTNCGESVSSSNNFCLKCGDKINKIRILLTAYIDKLDDLIFEQDKDDVDLLGLKNE